MRFEAAFSADLGALAADSSLWREAAIIDRAENSLLDVAF
jgi:hypothetical protein